MISDSAIILLTSSRTILLQKTIKDKPTEAPGATKCSQQSESPQYSQVIADGWHTLFSDHNIVLVVTVICVTQETVGTKLKLQKLHTRAAGEEEQRPTHFSDKSQTPLKPKSHTSCPNFPRCPM